MNGAVQIGRHVPASLGPVFMVAACLLGAVFTADAATGWTVHRGAADGFQIATPSSWLAVPGSPTAANKLAAALQAQGKVAAARLVRAYAADNASSGENRVLDGIQFPIRTSPTRTDFYLVKDHWPKGFTSDRTSVGILGEALFMHLKKLPGFRMTTKNPTFLTLPAGFAASWSGTVGAHIGFTWYLLGGPRNSEWQLELRTESAETGRRSASLSTNR